MRDQKLLLQKFDQAKKIEEKIQILSLVAESIQEAKGGLSKKVSFADADKLSDSGVSGDELPSTFQKVPKLNTPIIIPPVLPHFKPNKNRSKRLLVSGLESDQDKANIISLINSLGCEIENMCDQVESNNNANQAEVEASATTWAKSIVINFMARKDAKVVHYLDLF